MPVIEEKTSANTPIAAGKWLIHLCQKEGALGRALTPLENDKFNEFFEVYGQHPQFKNYHVEAVHRSLTGKDYRLAQALLAKDDSKQLLLDDACALQIAIKAVRIEPGFLDKSIRESAPQLLDTVKLLMDHGAVVNSLDEDGNSALFYTCVLGYAELFTLLCESGADAHTTHRRRVPDQLRQGEGGSSEANEEEPKPEKVNILQVTLDALISPQKILDFTWMAYPPGMNYSIYHWKMDLDATWGAIIIKLLQEGLICAPDDLGLVQLLHISCYQGAMGYVTSLLSFGASIDTANCQLIEEAGRLQGHGYGTALHAVSVRLQITVAQMLLQQGADPRAQRPCRNYHSSKDLTPAGIALNAKNVNDGDDEESCKALEFCEAIMQAESSLDEQDYLELLDFSAKHNKLEFIHQLLQRGVRPPQMPETDSLDVILLLLEHGVKVEPARLQTRAIKRNRVAILRWSVSQHGGLLPLDPEGWGSMMTEVVERRPRAKEMLEFLASEYPGPHVDSVLEVRRKERKRSAFGKTNLLQHKEREKAVSVKTNLLQMALEEEDAELVKLIVNAGADPRCPGLPEDGLTAFKRIANNLDDSLEIIRLLQEKLIGENSWKPPLWQKQEPSHRNISTGKEAFGRQESRGLREQRLKFPPLGACSFRKASIQM